MKQFLSILIVLVVSSVALGQPVAPTFVVNGYRVTFDADVIQLMPAADLVVDGIVLNDPGIIAVTAPSNNIVVDIQPDVHYTVFMLGREEVPGDLSRIRLDDSFMVSMTRTDQIRDAWFNLGKARAKIDLLDPTFDEYSDALSGR